MFASNYRNLVIGLILIVVITVPDIVFDALLFIVHTLIELIELGLDVVVEHIFHTSHHTTQVIVFYLMLFAGLYGAYRLLRPLPELYRRHKAHFTNLCLQHQTQASLYWRSQRLVAKFKLATFGVAGATCLVLLMFS